MFAKREFVLTDGRIIDPVQSLDRPGWLHIREGIIEGLGHDAAALPDATRLDARGLIICPGLIDLHVHLREPGAAHKETIASGCQAAVTGGFSTVCCMPNTSPAIDNVETLQWVKQRAAGVNLCHVHVIAAATRGRQGHEPVDFGALAQSGAVAFTDDGDGIESDDICRAVLEEIKSCGSVFCAHCEFQHLSGRGAMHLGEVSKRLGLEGYDPRGEEAMIERDLDLVAQTGAQYHLSHVSTAAGVELIRRAKAGGLPVTAEACPHHLLLSDEDVVGPSGTPDPNMKMSPPLRTWEDVVACVEGVQDGTIDCVATDHAPHSQEEKAVPFAQAPMGVIGLETALACAAKALLVEGRFGWPDLLECLSTGPARVLGLPGGSLRVGQPADVTLIDPDEQWTVEPARFRSQARNSPFAGWHLTGRAVATVSSGRIVHAAPSFSDRE